MHMRQRLQSAYPRESEIPDRFRLAEPLSQRGPDTLPFTGRKDSAEGTLSVSDALKVFSIRTLVATKENPPNKSIISDIVRERKSNFLSTDFIL